MGNPGIRHIDAFSQLDQRRQEELKARAESPEWLKHQSLYERLEQYDDHIGDSVDALVDLMDWLREDELFQYSDRLRTIIGRLARSTSPYPAHQAHLTRAIARGYK